MPRTLMKRVAYLAVGTVAVVGMTGAFGTVAFAAEDDNTVATSGVEFDTYAKSLLEAEPVQAVATDEKGNVVLYTTEAPAEFEDANARSLVESKDNVVVKVLPSEFTAYDANDVVGGAGYAALPNPDAQQVALCSVGFSAWSAAGEPAVISAGHCTDDGANVLSALTLPTSDTAGGAAADAPVELTQQLGTLAFSQYGGPGNSAGAEGDKTSVDISVIDVVNPALNLLPEVTDWTTASSNDLSASTRPVRSVGTATVGAPVAKSGRTTGFTEGTVQSVGGWAKVSGREVYGFMNILESMEGDSGGAIISGDQAIGILSGGVEDGGQSYVWAADLQASLAVAGDYTVALFIDAPVVTSPANGGNVYTGSAITGTAAAGTTLVVNPSRGDDFEVQVDANGNWSFPAPTELGPISYSLVAERGFDRSAATTLDAQVLLAPPAITSPTPGQAVETTLTAVTGTGEPGATVTLTGDVTGTAVVNQAGTWSIDADLDYGNYSVSAVQTRAGGPASTPVTVAFAVVPVAPVITNPTDGTTYVEGASPAAISGTGINGAVVSVAINGTAAGTATVQNGAWELPLTAQFPAGTVTITATQAIDGVTGTAATSTITVTAVTVTVPTVPAAPAGDRLANTGAPALPLLGGGVALLVVAGGMLLVARRRGVAQSNS